MRSTLSIIFLMLMGASIAKAGGSIGGGTGLVLDSDIALSLADNANLVKTIDIPDLGLVKKFVECDQYRRTRARLVVHKTIPISIDGEQVTFKTLKGGIVDTQEISQLFIED